MKSKRVADIDTILYKKIRLLQSNVLSFLTLKDNLVITVCEFTRIIVQNEIRLLNKSLYYES